MPKAETWTIGRLLEWTTDYLNTNGADSARLDAEVLLAEARGCDRIDLYTAFDQPASEETRVAFRELVRRRAEGMPVAYLVGRREFYGLNFRVTSDVLIPRPESEFIIVAPLDLARQQDHRTEKLDIADVGTGSGNLAVCAAKHLPMCCVVALDNSEAALSVAERNSIELDVRQQIGFHQSDLFSAVPTDRQFDFIISNPPYVSEEEFESLGDVRAAEPREALIAGPHGVDVIVRLLPQAVERLKVGGWLLMEISPMLESAVTELVNRQAGLQLGPVIHDLAGLARVIQAQRI